MHDDDALRQKVVLLDYRMGELEVAVKDGRADINERIGAVREALARVETHIAMNRATDSDTPPPPAAGGTTIEQGGRVAQGVISTLFGGSTGKLALFLAATLLAMLIWRSTDPMRDLAYLIRGAPRPAVQVNVDQSTGTADTATVLPDTTAR